MLIYLRMKKLSIFIASLVFIWFAFVGPAQAAPTDQEVIKNFSAQATLTPDRMLKVKETIEYDFGSTPKHGIYRYIPEAYSRNGLRYNLRFDVLGVKRDGQSEPYEVSRSGGDISLKIGKADFTMTGSHVYIIEYQTDKVINFFKDHSELYWNVNGIGWPVPVEKTSFELFSPLGASTTQQFACFTGHLGSTESSCTLSNTKDSLLVSADRLLSAEETMTVVFSFPIDMIKQPTGWEIFWSTFKDNVILIFPLIALASMLYLWSTRGKDPPPDTIIPQYEIPQGLDPLLLSAALGEGIIPSRGVTADLIEMARKGYLKIEYGEEKKLFGTKQTFTFVKGKEPTDNPKWHKTLWNGLFDSGNSDKASIDDLKEKEFYSDIQKAKTQATPELHKLHIFAFNPYAVRSLYVVAALISAFVVQVIGNATPAGFWAASGTFLVVAIVGWFMPRRTKEGTALVAEVKGFKWFLSVTEEERLKFHNAPARTPAQFMEFLPAAIALGVETEWAEQFKDLQIPPPDWYNGNMSTFNSILLVNSLSSMHSAAASAAYSPPASTAGGGGSGFSGGGGGGGFGGGGGGSW